MPNVTVTVTNIETNLIHTTTTPILRATTGSWRFRPAPIAWKRRNPDSANSWLPTSCFTVNQERRVDITMDVGSQEQQVEVSANAVQVETTSTQLGTVIEEKSIVNLPLNGRSYHRPALDPGRGGPHLVRHRATSP